MITRCVEDFTSWRTAARQLLGAGVEPNAIQWTEPGRDQSLLFPSDALKGVAPPFTIPKTFVDEAELVARHSDPGRWCLLYRVAWRITNGERNLLKISVDDDTRAMTHFRKEVEKDRYRMRAFVRFRRVSQDGEEWYVAWYTPEHRTLDLNGTFFRERFAGMRWAILTPKASMRWDMKELSFGPGVPVSSAPSEDALEGLWRAYYKSIYNPARLNLDAMRAQLPVRRWVELPESRAIPELVRLSRGMVSDMRAGQAVSAAAYVPSEASLPVLQRAIRGCEACDLCRRANGPVFGEGTQGARIVFVGEQPGDEEDRARRPFVGPAGQVFNDALKLARVNRAQTYVTNAVKAFKFEERGKRRIHSTPKARDIATCRPWLMAELDAIKPAKVICLGSSAAQSVLGRSVRINEERARGPVQIGEQAVYVTYHPSAVLRAVETVTQDALFANLVDDIRRAYESVTGHGARNHSARSELTGSTADALKAGR